MTYRQELDALGRHLAALSAAPEPLNGTDVEAAVAGFTATAQLLRRVHLDLVGSGPGIPLLIASLERPVPLLGRLLHELPDLAQAASPIDLQATPAASVAGAHWRAIARSATLAAHYWDTADPQTRPWAAAVHTEVAQIAALAEGLAAVGQDLAGQLRAADREWDADRLRTANLTALGIVAATARRSALASGGHDVTQAANPPPSPLPAADVRPVPPRLVLVVLGPSDLAGGLRRLDALLHGGGHLTPQHLRLVTRAVAAATLGAGRELHVAGHHAQAVEVLEHARLLTEVVRDAEGLASIWPSDQRPLAQAQQVYLQLASMRRSGTALDLRDAWAVAEALPAVTGALRDTAYRMSRTGAWLQRSAGSPPRWEPTGRSAEAPMVLQRLADAAEQGVGVRAAVALDGPSRTETAEGVALRLGGRGPMPPPKPPASASRPTPPPAAPAFGGPIGPAPRR